MLEEIHIQNLGIIEKADLSFHKGFTVISGETGAGKTMILSALRLLLGKRASADAVGVFSPNLSVEGCWDIRPESPVIQELTNTGAIMEDNQLFINRTITNEGKSRAVIGGKSTPVALLQKVSENLVSIHGQSDQIKLKDPASHRESLDRFGGAKLQKFLITVQKDYANWRKAVKSLKSSKESNIEQQMQYNALKGFVESFDELLPEVNEIETLENRILELSHIKDIRNGLGEAYGILNNESEDAKSLLESFSDLMDSVNRVGKYSEVGKDTATMLDELHDNLQEINDRIEEQLNDVDGMALQELEDAKDRLIDLKDFTRRNGGDYDALFITYENSSRKLQTMDNSEFTTEELEKKVNESYDRLSKNARALSELRHEASTHLSSKVNEELEGLAMKGSKLVVNIKQSPEITATGMDDVEFLLKAAGRAKAMSITKAASGGELSRIMLALEVSLNAESTGQTIVFDEIDSGVGGSTAIEIGKRLARLSKHNQIIVVSHLSQVACFADHNLRVVKTEPTTIDNSVKVTVDSLMDEEIVEEITRMLSGVVESDSGREHAKELLEMAHNFKASL